MAEKISCNATRDLLPLYTEHLLSPETEDEVKAHLEECEECRTLPSAGTFVLHSFALPCTPCTT